MGDGATTMAVVPSALIGAAAISIGTIGQDGSSWLASSLFVLTIAAYAGASGPGRRSRLRDFAFGGLILLALTVPLSNLPASMWDVTLALFELLFVVGYAPGGAHMPLFVITAGWWLSIMLLLGIGLAAGVLARAMLTRAEARGSGS